MGHKEEFAAIQADFVESQEFVDIAHYFRRGMDSLPPQRISGREVSPTTRFTKDLHWVSGYTMAAITGEAYSTQLDQRLARDGKTQ